MKFASTLGDAKLKLYWESNSLDYELVPQTAFHYELNSKHTPHSFTVDPATSNETTTTLVALAEIAAATVDVEEVHYLWARDKFGNFQNHQNDKFKVELTYIEGLYSENAQLVEAVITATEIIAKHEVKYTLSEAGIWQLRAYIQPNGIGPFFEISDSPVNVTASVTYAYAMNTILTGDGVTDAITGILQTFVVTLYDIGVNRLEQGGDTL